MRKISMSQNDPDELNPVISVDSGVFNLSDAVQNPKKGSSPSSDFPINLDSISNNFKSVEKIKEAAIFKTPLITEQQESSTQLFTRKGLPLKTEQQDFDEVYFMKKKQDYYTNKLLADQRNNLKMNLHLYQKGWIDSLKETNPTYERSKKELITLNRFNYNIAQIKQLDQSILVNEHALIQVYQSDTKIDNPKADQPSQFVTVPLTQVTCRNNLKSFDVYLISQLFNYPGMSEQEFQSLNSMVFTSNKDLDLVMEDQRFFASKKPRDALQETSMFTTLVLDSETKIDMYVKVKRFHTKTDGAFHLVTLAEVDVTTKVITGRYIVLKLSEQKDLELEQSMIKEQELKYKQDVI